MGAQTSECRLCQRPVEADGVTDDQDRWYCSPGCRQVAGTLGSAATTPARLGERTSPGEHAPTDTTFLHVDGMHCRSCEQFLEAVATDQEGVRSATASYVTETIRLAFDPTIVTGDALCSALSRVGYTATSREELATVADEHERRDDERRMDDLLGFRYAAGVLFGFFALMPYIVVIYPAQLAPVLGWQAPDLFAGGAGPGDALLLFPLFLFLTAVVLVFTGLPVLRGAYVAVRMRSPNTDVLVAIVVLAAFVAGTIAFLRGDLAVYYDLTIVIAATVVAAIFYESLVKQRAVDRLTDLTVSQVGEARRLDGDGTTTVPVEELAAGDRVLVPEGERVPVDGHLVEGACTVDEAVVTGESVGVRKTAGDDLLSGSLVRSDGAVVSVTDPPTSRIAGLTTRVWDLQSATHGVQRRSDDVATTILPVLAVAAVAAVAWTVLRGAGAVAGVLAGLTVLLVGTPWGVGLSTPLSVASSIQAALRRGVVVFDETVFERLRDTDVVVFDKTGTLTTGDLTVRDADAPDDLLAAVAALEGHAAHPAGRAIAREFDREPARDGGNGIERDGDGTARATERPPGGGTRDEWGTTVEDRYRDVRAVQTHETGIEGEWDGSPLLVGNLALFRTEGWSVPADVERRATEAREAGDLPVVVGRSGTAEGLVVLSERRRDAWAESVAGLARRGVDVVVLTGDDEPATRSFQSHDAVEHVFSGVPPAGKTATIRRLQVDNHVTMVGDGTNDGPALAAADLGIAMSSATALAAEAADLAILGDDLSAVETAFDLATASRRRLVQNTALALTFNAVTIPLAVAGMLVPVVATGAAVLTAGFVAVNSARPILP